MLKRPARPSDRSTYLYSLCRSSIPSRSRSHGQAICRAQHAEDHLRSRKHSKSSTAIQAQSPTFRQHKAYIYLSEEKGSSSSSRSPHHRQNCSHEAGNLCSRNLYRKSLPELPGYQPPPPDHVANPSNRWLKTLQLYTHLRCSS